jgi:hypothetical protein
VRDGDIDHNSGGFTISVDLEDRNMIDRTRERLIPIGSVPDQQQLWPDGTAPHAETVSRWARKGCRGVRLETVMLGGRRYSSAEAVNRFISQLSGE